jgi:hypothetical protein
MFDTLAQMIDATMALALHHDACRDYPMVAWVVCWDEPAFPEQYTARLATTKGTLPYVLVGETLAEVQAQLPPGLVRYGRRPVYPAEVIEMWTVEV